MSSLRSNSGQEQWYDARTCRDSTSEGGGTTQDNGMTAEEAKEAKNFGKEQAWSWDSAASDRSKRVYGAPSQTCRGPPARDQDNAVMRTEDEIRASKASKSTQSDSHGGGGFLHALWKPKH